jgi:hypothetical protein
VPICIYKSEETLVKNVTFKNMLMGLTYKKRVAKIKELGELVEKREIK